MIEIRITSGNGGRWRRAALLMIGALLLLWLGYVARAIWIPLLIAFLIAMVLDPLVDRMERRGWSRLKGATVIYLLFFVVFGVTLAFALPAIITQTTEVVNALGQYLPSDSETETKHALRRLLHKAHATPFVENTVLHASAQISQAVGKAGTWLGSMAQGMASNLIWLVIIPIVAFYALKDFHILFARMLLLVPRENRSFVQRVVNEVSAIFVRYLRGLMVVCVLNALATTGALALFHVPNALALGAISGVLYMVPYLGAALTIALIAGVTLMSGTVQSMLVIVAAMIVLHHVIFDQIITPRIVGQHVGLHPLLSIIALLIGGTLLGILGMILAVPFAATVQMILVTVFPKLGQPIEVPTGEELHEIANELAGQQTGDEVNDMADVHETLVAAVDSAEDEAAPPESGTIVSEQKPVPLSAESQASSTPTSPV
ncbi:MAG TPA: AI-2E family transporter [Chthonomonadaceae bacterium]|nr:AI-2E family transporter [Chthonomonadaceae bacterium]